MEGVASSSERRTARSSRPSANGSSFVRFTPANAGGIPYERVAVRRRVSQACYKRTDHGHRSDMA